MIFQFESKAHISNGVLGRLLIFKDNKKTTPNAIIVGDFQISSICEPTIRCVKINNIISYDPSITTNHMEWQEKEFFIGDII